MGNSERIIGNKISQLLDQLKKDRIILDIQVLGLDYEGLTMITDINIAKGYFLIDFPGGFDAVKKSAVGKRCFFEFSDQSKIHYNFRAPIESLIKDNIKINFPDFIERTQRRRFFRVAVPSGTKLFCRLNNIKYEFDVINISEGGVLIGIKSKYHDNAVLYKNGIINRFTIMAKNDDSTVNLSLETAEIVRLENHKDRGRYNYALKFTGVDRAESEKIRRFVYDCQRRILKQRDKLGI